MTSNKTDFKNEKEDWDLAGPLPDKVYFKKLVKRHFAFVCYSLIIVLIAAVAIGLSVKNTYESKIHAIFDQTDISGSGIGVSNQSNYQVVGRLFQARFESQEFLHQLGLEIGADRELEGGGFSPLMLISMIKKNIKALISNEKKLTGETDEDYFKRLKIVDSVRKRIKLEPERYTGMLNLTAQGDTPEKAAMLASRAMDKFIEEELRFQVAVVDRKLGLLQQGVEAVTAEPYQEHNEDPNTKKASPLKKLEIVEQETRLENEVKRITDELNRNRLEQNSLVRSHNAEIERLLGNLQPNHPTVVAKNRAHNIKMAALKSSEENISKDLEVIRKKLWRIRVVKVQAEGSMIPAGEGLSYQGAFFIAVSDRIKDLTLEKQNLLKQIKDPEQRTRLKVLFPATLTRVPAKSKRRIAAIATTAIGFLFIFGFVVYKEISHPLARDDWRIERSTERPILTQISSASLSKYTEISPKEADNLRENLRSYHKNDVGVRTLLSYRRLELAMDKHCTGKLVLLSSAGSSDKLGHSIYSFMNIFATDTGQRCLVWDFNASDPVFTKYEKGDLPDLVDIIEKKVECEKAIIRKHSDFLAFDLIPPSEKFQGEKTRIFTHANISPIVEKVSTQYDFVLLRSFPEYQFIENMVLNKTASDSFIFVDAKKTTYQDLERTITHMNSDKLRGLVLMGT